MVPGVPLPSSHFLSHLESQQFYFFPWNCLFYGETMVSVSCSLNVGTQLSAKSSLGKVSRQRLSSFLLSFTLYPGRIRSLQSLAYCSDLKSTQYLHFPKRIGLWTAPGSSSLDSAFSAVLVETFVISHIRNLFSLDSWWVRKLYLQQCDTGLLLEGWGVRFHPDAHPILFGEERTMDWKCHFPSLYLMRKLLVLPLESWWDHLTGFIRDLPPMEILCFCRAGVSASSHSLNHLKSKHFNVSFPGTACSVEKWWFHFHVL